MSTAPVTQINANPGALGATYTTASVTAPANTRLIVFGTWYRNATLNKPTITDSLGTITWTELGNIHTSNATNPDLWIVCWISNDLGASPSAMTITVASTSGTGGTASVISVLSADTDGTALQVASGEDLSTGDPSFTFGSTPGTNNLVIGCNWHGGGNAITKPTGYTNLFDNTPTNVAARRHEVFYDNTSAAIGPNQSTSGNQRSVVLAIELSPAAAGGAMVGSSTLSFAPSGTMAGAGVLAGSSALTFTPSSTASGAGALIGSSSLAFTTSGISVGIGGLVGSSSLVFTPSGTSVGDGALLGTSVLTFTPSGAMIGDGVLAGTAGLTFIPSGVLTGDGVLVGSSALAFTPSGVLTGDGALAASSSITFTVDGTLVNLSPPGAMTGTSNLSFSPSGTLIGDGILVGSSSLMFNVVGDMSPSLIGETSITFITSGTLIGIQSPYGFSSGVSPDTLYENNSGDGSFLYYETLGSSPDNPYEEN